MTPTRPFALLAAGAATAIVALVTVGTGGSGVATSPPVDGAALFAAKGCAVCHTGPDAPGLVGIGPDLRDAATWAGSRRPGTSAEDHLRQSILGPQAFISPAAVDPGFLMPALPLAPAELDALVEHLLDG